MTRTKAQWKRTEDRSHLHAGRFAAYCCRLPDGWCWDLEALDNRIRGGLAPTQAKAEAAALRSLRALVCRAWRDLMIDVQETKARTAAQRAGIKTCNEQGMRSYTMRPKLVDLAMRLHA